MRPGTPSLLLLALVTGLAAGCQLAVSGTATAPLVKATRRPAAPKPHDLMPGLDAARVVSNNGSTLTENGGGMISVGAKAPPKAPPKVAADRQEVISDGALFKPGNGAPPADDASSVSAPPDEAARARLAGTATAPAAWLLGDPAAPAPGPLLTFRLQARAGDVPAAGCAVALLDAARRSLLATTTTAADGSYAFADAPAGTAGWLLLTLPGGHGQLAACVPFDRVSAAPPAGDRLASAIPLDLPGTLVAQHLFRAGTPSRLTSRTLAAAIAAVAAALPVANPTALSATDAAEAVAALPAAAAALDAAVAELD